MKFALELHQFSLFLSLSLSLSLPPSLSLSPPLSLSLTHTHSPSPPSPLCLCLCLYLYLSSLSLLSVSSLCFSVVFRSVSYPTPPGVVTCLSLCFFLSILSAFRIFLPRGHILPVLVSYCSCRILSSLLCLILLVLVRNPACPGVVSFLSGHILPIFVSYLTYPGMISCLSWKISCPPSWKYIASV